MKMRGIALLNECKQLVIETDEENPVIIAAIDGKGEKFYIAKGYRICLSPKFNLVGQLKEAFGEALHHLGD